jgi:hypothetical protein
LAVPFAPPSLIIQAFGEMMVVINGKLMTILEWKSMLQREIFFFLLTQPNGASKDIIADAVWRYEGDRKKFDNALYRLRKVVGNEIVLYQDNRYVFNRELDYTYDVEIFQKKARAAVKEQDPIERIEKYKEAVGIYSGPYLLEAGGTWAIAERERLWLIFKDAALELRGDRSGSGSHCSYPARNTVCGCDWLCHRCGLPSVEWYTFIILFFAIYGHAKKNILNLIGKMQRYQTFLLKTQFLPGYKRNTQNRQKT